MDQQYWKSKIDELKEQGKYNDEGICTICGVQIIGDTAQETYTAQQAHTNWHKTYQITLYAYDVVEKIVKPEGNSGRVYVPRAWIGKRVKVVLVEPKE